MVGLSWKTIMAESLYENEWNICFQIQTLAFYISNFSKLALHK